MSTSNSPLTPEQLAELAQKLARETLEQAENEFADRCAEVDAIDRRTGRRRSRRQCYRHRRNDTPNGIVLDGQGGPKS